jgi:hypothetical protein
MAATASLELVLCAETGRVECPQPMRKFDPTAHEPSASRAYFRSGSIIPFPRGADWDRFPESGRGDLRCGGANS